MTKPLLVLAPRGRDAEVICTVLRDADLATRTCTDLGDLLAGLDGCSAAIVTEESLDGPALPGIGRWVEQQSTWSDLQFIVLATRQSGRRSAVAAATLEHLGNVVLLERPLNAETLASAGWSALRARRRQLATGELAATLEQRVAERTEALANSEARFRAVVEGFPEGLFVVTVTPDARFLFEQINPAAERRAGISSHDVAGQPAAAFMPAAQAASIEAQFARCAAAGTGISFTEEVQLPSGTTTYDTALTPLREPDGRITRLLGVSRDVTERNRLEERVRLAQKLEAVGQLTGGVAHDFNNLLQVVLSGLTMLERVTDPARRALVAESVRRAAQRGGELTKRLLTIARRQALRPEPVALAEWLDDGFGDLLSRTLRGDIRTVLRVPSDIPRVEVDPSELELAVLNLAVNARDAMPDGGTLLFEAAAVELGGTADEDGLSGRFIRFAVTDTGIGMDAAVQARVFEPFFTTKEVGKGTGLGLAQVYGFVRQSGGAVRLRSAPGQGTTVTLFLPVSNRRPIPAPVRAEPAGRPATGAAVLVCEDDEDVAALVVDMLGQLGHTPTRVGTAAAALGALADGRQVDLLFTDVLMPGGMDGLALAREARRRRPGLRVLLTTGYTGGGRAAEPVGAPVLRKPYRIEDLAAALENVLATAG